MVLARYMSVAKEASLALSTESYDQARKLEVDRVAKDEARTASTKAAQPSASQATAVSNPAAAAAH